MSVNRKISIAYLTLNIVGILCCFLYGAYGGSGGETTEGVFLGLFALNIISVLFCIVTLFIRASWMSSHFILASLFVGIYFPATAVVLNNMFFK
jgi:cadmium resistance protein CadD (predicted permease)